MLISSVVIPFLILSASGSKLPTYILPLMPPLAVALAAHWGRISGGVARRLGALAGGALVFWLSCAAVIEKFDHQMGRQVSVRNLANVVRNIPDFASAALFSCNVRAHGWEFYLGRVVSMTTSEADVVLTPTDEQNARLFKNTQRLEEAMRGHPVAYGIVRGEDFAREFQPYGWVSLGRSGDFVLIARSPADTRTTAP